MRAKTPAELEIRIPGLERTIVRDLSSNGVCCVTSHAFQILSHVHLVLILPTSQGTSEVPCDGAVVRSTREDGPMGAAFETAIFFTEIRDTDRSTIADYAAFLRSQGDIA